MGNTKTSFKKNPQRWVEQYKRRLEMWLDMMDASFFSRLRRELAIFREAEAADRAEVVKKLWGSEYFTSGAGVGDRLYIKLDFFKHPAFTNLQEKDSAKIWVKYAVICLILANANLLKEDIVVFFWRPVLAASVEDKMSLWPVAHLGLRIHGKPMK